MGDKPFAVMAGMMGGAPTFNPADMFQSLFGGDERTEKMLKLERVVLSMGVRSPAFLLKAILDNSMQAAFLLYRENKHDLAKKLLEVMSEMKEMLKKELKRAGHAEAASAVDDAYYFIDEELKKLKDEGEREDSEEVEEVKVKSD